jgi:hypothetical protein
MLRGRIETLQTLAENTDGIAIVNSNNIEAGLKRVVDDLTSYYLLGYYSTNAKSDGKFRKISVRVKRPGVTVRARRGYRAPTAEEVAARVAGATAPVPPPTPVASAIAGLGKVRADTPARFQVGYAWRAADGVAGAPATGAPGAEIWVVGELDSASARAPEWEGGGGAAITVTNAGGQTVASAEARVTPTARSFVTRVPDGTTLPPGEYTVRVTLRPASGGAGTGESTRLTVPDAAAAKGALLGQPVLFRRSPFTGVNYLATADPRFRRQDRVRVELGLAGGPVRGVSARLLDRAGQPLEVPVTASTREEAGSRAVVADLALAPLAAGDYVIEITVSEAGGEQKTLVPFRLIT